MKSEIVGGRQLSAPYLPMHALQAALEELKPEDMPHPIGRERFSNIAKSPLVQGQILNALRFFGLVNNHDEATYLLDQFVKRPEHFDEVVFYETLANMKYGSILDGEDRNLMTYAKLERKFADPRYNVNGGTRDAAIKFYLKLMDSAGKPLPSELTKKRGRPSKESQASTDPEEETSRLTLREARANASNRAHVEGRRATYRRGENGEKEDLTTERTIELKSGGNLVLSLSVNLFDLVGRDREFVFDLIDRLKAYQAEINPKILDEIK